MCSGSRTISRRRRTPGLKGSTRPTSITRPGRVGGERVVQHRGHDDADRVPLADKLVVMGETARGVTDGRRLDLPRVPIDNADQFHVGHRGEHPGVMPAPLAQPDDADADRDAPAPPPANPRTPAPLAWNSSRA